MKLRGKYQPRVSTRQLEMEFNWKIRVRTRNVDLKMNSVKMRVETVKLRKGVLRKERGEIQGLILGVVT